ncbi:hypothetical protein YC2023_012912 [Brassica napus]
MSAMLLGGQGPEENRRAYMVLVDGKEDRVSEWNNYKWNNYIDSLGNSLLYFCPLALFMFSLMFLINSQVLSLSFVFLGFHVFKQEELYGKLLTQILEVSAMPPAFDAVGIDSSSMKHQLKRS